MLARLPERLTKVTDVTALRTLLDEVASVLFGRRYRVDLYVTRRGDSGSLRRVNRRSDPPPSPLSGMGAGLVSKLPDQYLGDGSQMVVSSTGTGELVAPLATAVEGKLGAIVLRAPAGSAFAEEDPQVLASLAAAVTLSVQRLRAAEAAGSQRRIRTDLRLAREVQRFYLPPDPPPGSGFRVAATYLPRFEVGGDLYDFLLPETGELQALVGDASGKGVAAALLMTRITAEFRALASAGRSPAVVLGDLNRSLAIRPAGESFATALCLHLSRANGLATVANAGHVPPVLRTKRGEVKVFGDPSGAPLGFVSGESYTEETVRIEDGDLVLLMTDGLHEAFGCHGPQHGMGPTLERIARGPGDAAGMQRHLMAEYERSRPTDDQRDDVTLVVVQIGP